MTAQIILKMERNGLGRRSCSLARIKLSLENFSKSLKKLAYEYCSIKSDKRCVLNRIKFVVFNLDHRVIIYILHYFQFP